MIRGLDVVISFLVLVVFSPLLLLIGLVIVLESGWPLIFSQVRVGLNGTEFRIFKFRTMRKNAEKLGQLTVGMKDARVTPVGVFLRKYKLDELPQFFNVLVGDMSVVGPRPEVPRYVRLYTPEQRKLLNVRPGITDHSTLYFSNENALLAQYSDPEKGYIERVMPQKLRLSKVYLDAPTPRNYLSLIVQTILKIVGVNIKKTQWWKRRNKMLADQIR